MLQEGILEWFWVESANTQKYASIDARCQNLFKQFFPKRDPSVAKYELFEPLLRMGCLEFYGDNQFGLSPTCALMTEKYVLIMNLPAGLHENLLESGKAIISLPGIFILDRTTQVLQQLYTFNIPVTSFKLLNSLSKLPLPESIIHSWEDSIVIDSSSYLYYQDQWLAGNGCEIIGVYKKSNKIYAERLCRLNTGAWKTIPNREKNPDAFNLAVTWSKLNNDLTVKIYYDPELQLLSVREWQFPMLIERLLVFNTLLQARDVSGRDYSLDKAAFRQLNKWLNNKITIKHE